MKKDFAVSGLHVGEHSFVPEQLTREFEARGIDRLSFLTIRTRRDPVEERYFCEWARWCREHRVYFMFLYTIQQAPPGRESQLTPEIVARIRDIAGEYFLGDQIGEVGSVLAATPRGYHGPDHVGMTQNLPDMRSCRDEFLRRMRVYTDIDRRLGMPHIACVEATALLRYTLEAGCDLPLLEMMPGDPEFLISLLRGCAKAYDTPSWGTYIAHEWYGGLRHEDPLKRRRLSAAYRYAYLAGSHILCLESGDERIQSYGMDFPQDSELCRDYRRELRAYEERLRSHPRPAAEPEVRVAFVYGNLDAFTSWQGGCVWGQYDREEWSYGEAEWSWRILEKIRHGRSWQEIENYGDEDLSAAPGYGLYDVIPATADAEHLAPYDVVIFVGWNTMTPEIAGNLRAYAEAGGRVVLTAAHLNTNAARDGLFLPLPEAQTLTGCRITGTTRVNTGVKFIRESMDESIRYPYVRPGCGSDPILASGSRTVCETEPETAVPVAVYHDAARPPRGGELPAVLENRVGRGVVTLITAAQYPGSGAVWPLYECIVREQLTASHRRCPIHVLAPDSLRFSVWHAQKGDAVCLLNTDLTNPVIARVRAYGEERTLTIPPCGLEWTEFQKP